MIACLAGMAVVGDNRGGRQGPVAPGPDGSWPLDDARKRREQRTAAPPTPAPPPTGQPDNDPFGYALNLADNVLTSDGRPCTDEILAQAGEATSSALAIPAASDPDRPQPIADDILRALQQGDQRPERDANLAAPDRQRSSSQARPAHRPRPRRRLLIACAATAILAAALVVRIAPGTQAPARGIVSQRLAGMTTNPVASLDAAAANAILAVARAADRKLNITAEARRPARARQPRPASTVPRPRTHHSGSTQTVSAAATSNTATRSVSTPEPTAPPPAVQAPEPTTRQISSPPPPASSTDAAATKSSSTSTNNTTPGPTELGEAVGSACNPSCP
jgi:hypothetical protein